MISKSFLKSSFIYTLGGALPMVASLILLPFYSNMLDSQHFVALGFYISISLFLQILFSYSLDTYFGVKYTELLNDSNSQKSFTGTISILLIIVGLIVSLASLIAGPFLFPIIFEGQAYMDFGAFAVASIFTSFFNSFFKTGTNLLIYLKRPQQFLLFNFINFVATISISLAGLHLYPNTLIGPISGRFFSGVIIFILGVYIFRSASVLKFETQYMNDIYRFCTPYLLFTLSSWVLLNIDKYFLRSHIDSNHLAAYDQMGKCYFGIEFLLNSLSAIIFPKLFEIWSKNKKYETTPESNRYFNVFTAINIILLIVFCLAIPLLITWFIPKPEYYHSFNYIGLIASGYATRGILNFYLATILYSKSIKTLLQIFVLSSVVQVIATYILVNAYGLTGAIIAGLITKFAQILLSYLLTQKVFVYHINYLKIYGVPLMFILVNICCFFFLPGYHPLIYAGQFIFFSGVFYAIFKNEIRIVLEQFLKKKTDQS